MMISIVPNALSLPELVRDAVGAGDGTKVGECVGERVGGDVGEYVCAKLSNSISSVRLVIDCSDAARSTLTFRVDAFRAFAAEMKLERKVEFVSFSEVTRSEVKLVSKVVAKVVAADVLPVSEKL